MRFMVEDIHHGSSVRVDEIHSTIEIGVPQLGKRIEMYISGLNFVTADAILSVNPYH
jgi:hypothetical protein